MDEVFPRLVALFTPLVLERSWWPLIALGLAVAAVATPLWVVVRVIVVIVHELGHAVVGILCGRRFTGIVIRMDMGGHAVTQGPPRGFGMITTAFAGYPAPAWVGACIAWAALAGWADPVLVIFAVSCLLSLVKVRSFFTFLAFVGLSVAALALWWWAAPELRSGVVLGAALVLLVGAIRQFSSVLFHGGGQDDPAQLARLTGIPTGLWLFILGVVIAIPVGITVLWLLDVASTTLLAQI
ncbi:MAG: M50 family metallopeptidase [Actinomycetaceae bacterium]|nr:M50 family metallopeptidase [Actinomycetaceae bacterium]